MPLFEPDDTPLEEPPDFTPELDFEPLPQPQPEERVVPHQ